MYKERQGEYQNSKITIIEDNEDISKLDITTSKGHMFRDKALMIAEDNHEGDYTVLVSNLTDVEKVNIFDALDASLHENTDTNAYMVDKITNLEDQIDSLTESFKCNNEDSEYDGEYDFYEK
jgi:hypothetical protein